MNKRRWYQHHRTRFVLQTFCLFSLTNFLQKTWNLHVLSIYDKKKEARIWRLICTCEDSCQPIGRDLLVGGSYLKRMFDHQLGAAKSLLRLLNFFDHILHISPLILSLRAVASHSVFAVVLSEIGSQPLIRSSLNLRRNSWDAVSETHQSIWQLAKVLLIPELLRWSVKQSRSGALTIPARLGRMRARLRFRAKTR